MTLCCAREGFYFRWFNICKLGHIINEQTEPGGELKLEDEKRRKRTKKGFVSGSLVWRQ